MLGQAWGIGRWTWGSQSSAETDPISISYSRGGGHCLPGIELLHLRTCPRSFCHGTVGPIRLGTTDQSTQSTLDNALTPAPEVVSSRMLKEASRKPTTVFRSAALRTCRPWYGQTWHANWDSRLRNTSIPSKDGTLEPVAAGMGIVSKSTGSSVIASVVPENVKTGKGSTTAMEPCDAVSLSVLICLFLPVRHWYFLRTLSRKVRMRILVETVVRRIPVM